MASPNEIKVIFFSACASYIMQIQKIAKDDLNLNLANWQRIFAGIDADLLQRAVDAHTASPPPACRFFPSTGDINAQLEILSKQARALPAPATGEPEDEDALFERIKAGWLRTWEFQEPTLEDIAWIKRTCHYCHGTGVIAVENMGYGGCLHCVAVTQAYAELIPVAELEYA